MIFFYTGASQDNTPQNDPSRSLGGYISNSIIPNSLLGNIFPSISYRNVMDGKEQIRAIVLKNTFPTTITNIKIYTTTPEDSIGFITIGKVEPFKDSCNAFYLESIQVEDQSPYYVDFLEVEGLGNAITIPSMESNAVVGLWLKRTVTQTESHDISNTSLSCLAIAEKLEGMSSESSLETLVITVEW